MTKGTIILIQRLLLALGNSPGTVDGVWGNASQAALEATCMDFGVVAQNGKQAIIDDISNDDFWSTIRYFRREEFRCPCDKCGGYPVEPDHKLVRFLDNARATIWKNNPVTIVPLTGNPHAGGSGIRCAEYNATLSGSVANSKHMEGKAADIIVKGLSSNAVKSYLDQCVKSGELNYVYCITKDSTHIDIK